LHNAQKPHAARAAFAQTPYSQLMDWYDVSERSEGKSCSTQDISALQRQSKMRHPLIEICNQMQKLSKPAGHDL
jgi:hypothetical protein